MATGLVWFRRDLRLDDNPAWASATATHDRVTALFVVDPHLWEPAGRHRLNQLVAHLEALDRSLGRRAGRLLVRRGDPARIVPAEAERLRAPRVYWNADVSPYAARRDEAVAAALPEVEVHHGTLVQAPGQVLTREDNIYRVFTPFYRSWRQLPRPTWPEPGDAAPTAEPGDGVPQAPGRALMEPGEAGARQRLSEFLERVDDYHRRRDRPDLDGTSRLSADLKFGTLGPRRLAAAVGESSEGRRSFVRQLAWRDFHAHLLAEHPQLVNRALKPEYDGVAWREAPDELEAWQQGRTGYPLVDAGMRELAETGWMHNRVRMLTASFLVKDLLIDWRQGERHFRRLLVDADPSQNVGNWQWVAGTGADAAPYFRIFNPVTQSRKFDPEGRYIRRWVPELARLEAPHLHAPWEAPAEVLAAAGVELGTTYPPPLVDHAAAREETLAAYQAALQSD